MHDFPHCAICFQDASEGEAWVRFPCRHGMHPTFWDEYVPHAVDYHRGLRTCPGCRERLIIRSPFRNQFGPFDDTVQEGTVFRGPPTPAQGRRLRGGGNHEGAAATASGGSPRGHPDPSGPGADTGREGDGADDNRVAVLVLGAAGGFVQALYAHLSARSIQAVVVAVSSVPVGRGGVIDEEWAIANAIRVWGSQSLRQAETVGPIGRPSETRNSEASLFPVQLMGAVFITARLAHSEGGSTVFVGFRARRGLVWVTSQGQANGRLHNRLFDLGKTARGRGASIMWPVQKLKPRGDDGLGEIPPPEVSIFSIFYTRAGIDDIEGWLVNELRGIEGCSGYGDGIAVAARGDPRGAVMFAVAMGSVPSTLHKIMMNGPRIGVKAVATDTGFAIIGTSLATYDGFIEAIGLEAHGGGIAPPVRCEIGDNGYGYPAPTCQPVDEGYTSRCLCSARQTQPRARRGRRSRLAGHRAGLHREKRPGIRPGSRELQDHGSDSGAPLHYSSDQQHRLRADTGLRRGSPDRSHPVHLRRHRDRTHTRRQSSGDERTRGCRRSPGGPRRHVQHGCPNREGGVRRRGVRLPASTCLPRATRAVTVGSTGFRR